MIGLFNHEESDLQTNGSAFLSGCRRLSRSEEVSAVRETDLQHYLSVNTLYGASPDLFFVLQESLAALASGYAWWECCISNMMWRLSAF